MIHRTGQSGQDLSRFQPHDRTVALLNTQGIGWKGVPDTYTSRWTESP